MKEKSQETNENQCVGCGKHDALFECTGCHEAYFCSQDCQKKTWSTHRFDCLPCSVCGERLPGAQVRRDCACKKGGYSHVTCLVKEAVEDSSGEEWNFSSTHFEKCKLCGEPYTGDVKKVLDGERKARVGKAKERLQILLLTLTCEENQNQYQAETVERARDCVQLYRGLYGKDDWTSNNDIYWATFFLGRALLLSGRHHVAAETLELARMKLCENKPHRWKHPLIGVMLNLARAYSLLGEHNATLPLYEELYEKHYQSLVSENRFRTTKWLAECYSYTSAWKKARIMVEVARKLSERLFGSDDKRTVDLIELGETIIDSSYNAAKSLGMDDIPDDTDLEIIGYCDSCFEVAVFRDASREFEFSSNVPVERVIMIPDSDVVLHSLKGARHLNGKLGIVDTFNHELGRYVVIVEGSSKTVNVKPQNLLPAYMGSEKEEMIELAIHLSQEEE